MHGSDAKRQKRCQGPRIASRPSLDSQGNIEAVDMSDQAVAEALLGLSHAALSSPGSSVASGKTHLSPPRVRRGSIAVSEQRKGAKELPEVLEEGNTTDEEAQKSDAKSIEQAGDASRKRVPSRCKCGKRVSADHPPCKSELMLLCERFQERFCKLTAEGEPAKIDLNDVTEALGCGRRRLYDITIAYEAAEVLQRNGKLSYIWKGTDHLPTLVETLRREEANNEPVGQRGDAPAHNRHGNHSMWSLSRKLMRLLLTTQGPVSLSEAADHLIGDSVKGSKRQQTQMTVERRLYDIGSILSTLDLIDRIYADGRRQPSFSWKYGIQQVDDVKKSSPPAGDILGGHLDSAHSNILKRKQSDDSASTVSTCTNDLAPGLWAAESFSKGWTGTLPASPQLEIDSLVASPVAAKGWTSQDCPWTSVLAAPMLYTSLASTHPMLRVPDHLWGFGYSGYANSTLCRPQATRASVQMSSELPSLLSSTLPELFLSRTSQFMDWQPPSKAHKPL